MKKLVLVDGNAIVHRAYHALPPLTKKDGKPTNAVYGFFSMILKITTDLNPDNLVVCFDKKAPTFRKQMFVGYQSKRPKMDDELSNQFVIIHEVLEKAKINVHELDGYEADDLIGTLARQAVQPSSTLHHLSSNQVIDKVIILTGDRDLIQLVNKKVVILAPIVGVTKMILFDEEKVKEKYGLSPAQFVDYKALVGDSSDNYPGVSGIGPKTASNLINTYGSFEEIYKNLGDINPKVAEKLAQDAEQAAMAKKLATIVKDVPIDYNPRESDLSNFDRAALLKEFEDLRFSSLIKRYKLDNVEKETKPKKKKQEELKDQLGLL